VLIRSWNVFHGRSHPPGRTLYLERMIRLAARDRPDVLCLQEVPPWSLERLGEWSGMAVFGAVGARPSLGPFPSTAELGRRLTALDPARFRGAFAGQANAILVAPHLRVLERDSIVLNARSFRRAQARRFGLPLVDELYWAKERRVCQALRVVLADGGVAAITNFHATGSKDKRIPDAEVLRAATFADALAGPDEVCMLVGDFNVTAERSLILHELTGPEWGFSAPGVGIDHVLVRGAESDPPKRWPIAARQLDGVVVSDHAPVDVWVHVGDPV
jgi:endonuclease/exonuclease/phosphatase family metal-dependent hydrolase